MLSPVTAIALTGLDAAANRLSVAAHNISNMNTDGFKAYVAEDVEVRGRMGVYTAIARPNPPGPQVLDEKGRQKTLSNTDVPHEAVQMMLAQRAYQANLRALKVADGLQKETLDLIG